MNNSNRLFHWSKSFNLDPLNKYKTLNISKTPSNTTDNSIKNISTLFKKGMVPFFELINLIYRLFLNSQLRYINAFYNSKTNLWTDTRPLYFDNLTRSISVYIPKNIIKFTSTSYPEPKVIIELCNANEQRLNDSQEYAYADKKNKNNNINNTASLPSMVSSALICYPQRG